MSRKRALAEMFSIKDLQRGTATAPVESQVGAARKIADAVEKWKEQEVKTKSVKAKGRKAAVEIQKRLLEVYRELTEDDLRVTPSGIAGEDLQRSPKACEILPYAFEIKCQETLKIWQTLEQAKGHVKSEKDRAVVVFRRNRTPFHVCMEFNTFLELLRKGKENEQRAG